jgi:hypothetical protein
MATDIVQSLFGVTPELYQQQQAAAADQRALAIAQLNPMQRAEFNIGRSAYQLAGALGGTDPELARISLRQSLAKQIDFNDPASIQAGVQQLSQAGDTRGAMMLADTARKASSEIALARQRGAERMTPEQRNAMAYAAGLGLDPNSKEFRDAYLAKFEELTARPDRTQAFGVERESIARELYGKPFSQLTQSEIAAVNKRVEGTAKAATFGVEREAVARELYNKPFSELTQQQIAAVNKRVEDAKPKTTITNVLPGDRQLVDIPAFRMQVQKTIDPQSKAVFAADNALTAIEDSLKTNNFISFNAARTQLAKALGDSQLSRRDVEQAGGDPSILGRLADATSVLFTGTPTVDTQNKIKQTLNAIRTVSANKAMQEIGRQRAIALRSPGYSAEAVDAALDFPEFAPRPAGGAPAAGGDLAAQAAAELARRRQGAK